MSIAYVAIACYWQEKFRILERIIHNIRWCWNSAQTKKRYNIKN